MRFLHLASAAKERAIRRAGLAGGRAVFPDESGAAVVLRRAVYAMPVVPDFWTSHQWVRELRRQSGERVVAVHFRLADDELVHVGRFGQPHRLVAASAAARWVMDNPDGAEVVVPRSIARREVVAVREAPQLVGWVQSPDEKDPFGCVCSACLPAGTPELMRRVRAAFRAGIDRARRAGDDEDELVHGLSDVQFALERARGRLAPGPVLAYARSPSPRARREVAWLLRFFRRRQVEETLVALAHDADEGVRENAVDGLLRVSGALRAGVLLAHAPAEARAKLAELVELDASLFGENKRRRRG
ncbi:MAG TPA: HEAT repeat domain-containing protein [Thermoanaerobaculia bacterium]|nr:HEAT repeat domain-containing protein [Thermoanaerobaculia bacterium]